MKHWLLSSTRIASDVSCDDVHWSLSRPSRAWDWARLSSESNNCLVSHERSWHHAYRVQRMPIVSAIKMGNRAARYKTSDGKLVCIQSRQACRQHNIDVRVGADGHNPNMGDKHGLDVGNNGDSDREVNGANGDNQSGNMDDNGDNQSSNMDDSDDKDGNDIDVRFGAGADPHRRGTNMDANDSVEVVNNGDSDRDGNNANGDNKNSRIDDGDSKDGNSDNIDNEDVNSDVGDDRVCEINDVGNCRSGVGHGGEEMRVTQRDGGTDIDSFCSNGDHGSDGHAAWASLANKLMALEVFCCRSGLRAAYTIGHYLHVSVNPGREQVSAHYWGGDRRGGYAYKLVMSAAASRRAQETKVTLDLATL